ncbi:hypothetical protein OF83DRAFT_1110151 [Amylostereum chailletii]|nr:hypothetical protein OF83DRAFT_1110151 [Amylostereum chailletii]
MPDCLGPKRVSLALSDLAYTKKQVIFPLLFETFLFGILTLLVIVSTYAISSKELRSRPRRLLVIVTLTMYALSAALWSFDVYAMWYDMSVMIPADLATGDSIAPGSNPNTDFAEDVLFAVIFVMSDSVALWRACVIWGMHKGMRICSAVLILVQICTWVVYLIQSAVDYLGPDTPASFQPLGSSSGNVDLIAVTYSVTITVNIWATAMIAYKTWKHRRNVRLYLHSRTGKSAVEAGCLLLVESGVLYAVFWIVFGILQTVPTTSDAVMTAASVFFFGLNQIPGIYFTLVIVIVELKQSHFENALSNMRPGASITTPFPTRVPQATVRTDGMDQQHSIRLTIPGAQLSSGTEIIVVAKESLDSLSEEVDEHAGIKLDEKSGRS